MRRLAALIAVLATAALAVAGLGAPPPQAARAPAFALPSQSALAGHAQALAGPRVDSGRRILGRAVTLWGASGVGRRVLVAGCVDGVRCAGTDVVRAVAIGCPPDDADLWLMPTLRPRGEDLDADQSARGAAAWRQAVADLRPDVAITFRTGSAPAVFADGRGERAGRRLARVAGLPFVERAPRGLATWASAAVEGAAGISVALPPGRATPRDAARLAHAIDVIAGTRFAEGADEERQLMIRHGADPRDGKA
jgi:hypothetical protein